MFSKKHKCECRCEINLHIQNVQHVNDMTELANKFDRLYHKFAWLSYQLTGDQKHLDEYEFNRKNGTI